MLTQAADAEIKMMTLDDVADITRYSPRQIQNFVTSGKIPQPIRIGSRPRWRRSDILDWINAGCPVSAQSPDVQPMTQSEKAVTHEEG